MRTRAGMILFVVFSTVLASQAQDATWETVSIPGICTYQIPPTVEIQKGTYKRISDQFRKNVLEISDSPDRVVAQPKGINDFDPVALKRYCRIIVETERGSKGDYAKLDEPLVVSEAELRELEQEMKSQFKKAAELSTTKGMKMTILSWQPLKVVRVNGVDALLATYSRSMNDAPAVLVRIYKVQNNDCFHAVTISYRENEKDLWATDLDKVIDTFKFKKSGGDSPRGLYEKASETWQQLGLVPFTSVEDGFSAWFPAKPEKSKYGIVTNYAVVVESEAAYNVHVNEFPGPVLTDKAIDASFKGYLEGRLLAFGKDARITKSETVAFIGRRALDYEYIFEANGTKVYATGVAFHEGRRLYCVSVVCPEKTMQFAYSKYRAFRDSFRLTTAR